MKKLILFCLLILNFVANTNSHSQIVWNLQQSGTTETINSIYFYGVSYGWYCGSNGVIGKTSNGGINWTLQQSNTTYNLYSIYFLNWNYGWATGGYTDSVSGGHMVILKTTNGGDNWIIQKDESSNYFPTSVYFFNEYYGYAACQGYNGQTTTGGILKTSNSGTNWTMISNSYPASQILFTNYYTAYCLSKKLETNNNIDTAIIYKSIDGGANWVQSFRKPRNNFKNIFFINANTGIVQADSNNSQISSYYKTTNSGNNWFLISSGNNGHYSSFFTNDSNGWAVGNQIYKTTNGGTNWNTISIIPTAQLKCVYFRDYYNGWSGGIGGVMYHSSFQDTSTGDFFPLNIGNRFVYLYSWSYYSTGGGSSSGSRLTVMMVTDTATFYGKKYYYCTGIPSIVQGWVRIDTVTKSLYSYNASNNCPYYYYESLVDSLGMTNSGGENSCHGYYCYGLAPDILFNTSCNQIHFSKLVIDKSNVLTNETHRYYNKVYGFKTYSSSFDYGTSGGSQSYTLKGCKINGLIYGDTAGISTAIINTNTAYPYSYSLSQNYPNPFNPTTKIKFDVSFRQSGATPNGPGRDLVILKVFDVTGREIQTLVNEALQPGSYEISFDGSGLNSGVYFYKMVIDGYSETKRMILLK